MENITDVLGYRDGDLFWKKSHKKHLVGAVAGTVKRSGYRLVQVSGKLILAHRIVWAIHHGKFPDLSVDHINQDKDDNRIENLRLATVSQQQMNMAPTSSNKSGLRGVFWKRDKKKWEVTLYKDGVAHYGGRYGKIEDAKKAQERMRSDLFGDFA